MIGIYQASGRLRVCGAVIANDELNHVYKVMNAQALEGEYMQQGK
jgi:hypothetical protein